MNSIENYNEKIFEDIKHIDEDGNVYWYARELQKTLDILNGVSLKVLLKKLKQPV